MISAGTENPFSIYFPGVPEKTPFSSITQNSILPHLFLVSHIAWHDGKRRSFRYGDVDVWACINLHSALTTDSMN
jgi:hypothetical protein